MEFIFEFLHTFQPSNVTEKVKNHMMQYVCKRPISAFYSSWPWGIFLLSGNACTV